MAWPALRKQIKKTVFLFILMTGSGLMRPCYSQNKDWHLTRLSTADGLASSEISVLFQDSHYFLWIGHTAGLSRFDGYDFENLLFAGDHRVGKVYAIIEDKDQTIWVGAEGGLFFYRQNRLFYAETGSAPSIVYALALHTSDSLWVGTGKGPAALSIPRLRQATLAEKPAAQQGNETGLKILPAAQNSSLAGRKTKFISVAKDSTVYFSTGYTLFKYAGDKLSEIYSISNNRDYITGLVGLNADTVYISSQLSGFWMIDKGNIQRHSFSDGIGNFLTRTGSRLLYFATEGVYTFDPETNKSRFLIAVPGQYQEWGSCVLRDIENNIWIGTHEELLFARPDLFHSVDQSLLEGFNELYALYENADGSLLAGGNRGRIFKKENSSGVQRQGESGQSFSLSKTVFPLSEVFDIYKTENGDTWFCSGYEGLSLLRNGKLTRYTAADGLRSNGNYTFLSTPDKKLFACGENGVTEIIYSPDNRISFKNYYTISVEDKNYTIVTDGITKPDGSLLLSSDRGLLEWKDDSLYSVPILNFERRNPSITGIRRDNAGNIWLSTIGDGILYCRNEENKYVLKKQFGIQDGLSSMIYLQLLIDNRGMVWAIGYKDMARIEPRSETEFFVKSYSRNHGFTTRSFHLAKLLQDKTGRIWAATSAGLMYFEPGAIDYSYHKPVCKITGISFPDKKGNKSNNTASRISSNMQLPWHSRSLVFHFTGVHLSDPMAVHYAYRLLGADSSWVTIGREKSVNLQQLSPGDYIFQVKASLGSHAWSNIESYTFTVLSPWWQRWWVILPAAFCLIALSILIIRRREKNIQFKADSLQHQLEIEQIVNFFATSMSGQKSIGAMLWDVTKNCISKLGFEDCIIYLKDEKRDVLIQKAAWGPKTTNDDKIFAPIEIPLGRGIVGSVALSGNAEIVADTSIDARYIVDDMRRGSEISVPIMGNNAVIGVIDSEHSQKKFYTERHLQVLTTIASLVTDKIDKIKAEQKASRKEIEVLKLNQDLTISQLTALRAQMSPHFIFNALNSVQQYILQGNVIEANKYLSKFSKLQREILNHCDQNFILLEKEMEMLDLYLQLEQLRFNGLFSYNLHLDDDIDADEIKIPPMMVQPFVENAIWHGLMPKPDNRTLDINFSLTEDDMLLCTIKDNGIGREAASRLQQSTGKGVQHKSKGLSLVYERMNVLRQQYKQPFEVSITDLINEQGNPEGTSVTLTVFAGH